MNCVHEGIWESMREREVTEASLLEHPIMHPNGHEEEEKHSKVAHGSQGIIRHQEGRQDICDVMKLMTNADEDERGDEDIGNWVWGNKHQHAVGVSCQPHVILTHEQLQGDTAKPGKEGGVASPEDPNHVPQDNEPRDLEKKRTCWGKNTWEIEKVMRYNGQEFKK